jgi:hypothetical protein
MKNAVADKTSKTKAFFFIVDYSAFTALMIFLAMIIVSSGMANIQTDSIDYYAIV